MCYTDCRMLRQCRWCSEVVRHRRRPETNIAVRCISTSASDILTSHPINQPINQSIYLIFNVTYKQETATSRTTDGRNS